MPKRTTRLQPSDQGTAGVDGTHPTPSLQSTHTNQLEYSASTHAQMFSGYTDHNDTEPNAHQRPSTELHQPAGAIHGQAQNHHFDDNTAPYQQMQPNLQQHQFRKRRVDKACDMCRIKKTKCDGGRPCSRCVLDNRICSYTDRRKTEKLFPQHHVEMLETRVRLLSKCLEGLFKKAKSGEDVSYMTEKDGSLAINTLMEELGLIDFQIQTVTLDELPMFAIDSERKDSVQSVDSQISTERYSISSQHTPLQQHMPASDMLDPSSVYQGYQQAQQQSQHKPHTSAPQHQQNYNATAHQSNSHQPSEDHTSSSSNLLAHQQQHQQQQQQQHPSQQHHSTKPDHVQTDVPIHLDETLFGHQMLPPFEDMNTHTKHFSGDDFVFEG